MNYFDQNSERLSFRKFTNADIDDWSSFFENNDRLHFLGIDDITKDKRTLSEETIVRQLDRYENDGCGMLAVIEKESGHLIGMCGIIKREIDEKIEFEIGYSIKPSHWNQGYGTEAAQTMKKYGQTNKIAARFISIIHKENKDSMNVAKKNGMEVLFETTYMGMAVFVFGDPY